MGRRSSVQDGAALEASGSEREKDQPKKSSPDSTISPLPEKERGGEGERKNGGGEKKEEEAKEQEMGGLREGNKR